MSNKMPLLLAGLALIAGPAFAQMPIKAGLVLRGVKVLGAGVPGTKVTGRNCDFSGEEVDQSGRMTGASVQAGAGKSRTQLTQNLPPRFNAYCVVDVGRLGGARLITAPIPGDPEHADLSAMKPKDAQQTFGGAIWR